MLFSIVTPSFNCAQFLPENLDSIRRQGIPSDQLEHWVIDGGSTDGTVEILKQRPEVKWVSERDRGLSDAVNKGVQRASGDWIIWLNGDDILADNALKTFLAYTKKYPDIRMFCGSQTVLRYDGTVEQTDQGWDYNLKDLMGMRTSIIQASTFAHRDVFAKVGLLDISIRCAMDYEWIVRAAQHYKCVAIPEVLTLYRRRKGSIMDANMAKHYETILAVRRQYGKPRFSRAEFRVRFYIYTDWLRRIQWLRRGVRYVKGLAGREPLHPMS